MLYIADFGVFFSTTEQRWVTKVGRLGLEGLLRVTQDNSRLCANIKNDVFSRKGIIKRSFGGDSIMIAPMRPQTGQAHGTAVWALRGYRVELGLFELLFNFEAFQKFKLNFVGCFSSLTRAAWKWQNLSQHNALAYGVLKALKLCQFFPVTLRTENDGMECRMDFPSFFSRTGWKQLIWRKKGGNLTLFLRFSCLCPHLKGKSTQEQSRLSPYTSAHFVGANKLFEPEQSQKNGHVLAKPLMFFCRWFKHLLWFKHLILSFGLSFPSHTATTRTGTNRNTRFEFEFETTGLSSQILGVFRNFTDDGQLRKWSFVWQYSRDAVASLSVFDHWNASSTLVSFSEAFWLGGLQNKSCQQRNVWTPKRRWFFHFLSTQNLLMFVILSLPAIKSVHLSQAIVYLNFAAQRVNIAVPEFEIIPIRGFLAAVNHSCCTTVFFYLLLRLKSPRWSQNAHRQEARAPLWEEPCVLGFKTKHPQLQLPGNRDHENSGRREHTQRVSIHVYTRESYFSSNLSKFELRALPFSKGRMASCVLGEAVF